ncbi:MAG: HAD-IA family hydrolase [Sulfuricurvum sp.]|jgi:HAD superfamily hydrolase (TIGR01549 family)
MSEKLVIFDFADTIAKLSPSKEELLQSFILEEIDLNIPLETIAEVYHYATNLIFYSSVSIHDINAKKEFYEEFNQNIIALLGISHLIDTSKLFDYFNVNGQHWILKDEVIELFVELKSKGYLISLVSNFDTRLYDVLNKMKISNYFDSIFISQEVGLEKPDTEFFKLPLKKHNIKAENSFFIGDSYLLDFIPSNKLGINSILLDENNKYSVIHKFQKISSIKNCIDIICKE